MNLEELRTKVREWDSKGLNQPTADAYYQSILNELEHHARGEWRVYLPTEHPDFNPSYMERLASWVGNVSDEADQKLMLEYALQISFFSHDDFAALYRTALDRETTKWIAGQLGITLEQGVQTFQKQVHTQIHKHTWFCPITDSMDINEFYKVNHIQGVGHRPCFYTLQSQAQHPINPDHQLAANWLRYMANPHPNPHLGSYPELNAIVLLEDIVGSGSQCIKAIQWAVSCLDKPVLFIPLILCPNGAQALNTLTKQSNGKLSVQPVIQLCRGDLLGPERQNELIWAKSTDMESLAIRHHNQARFNYNEFGYNQTGCSLVTFANAPDNTLPLVHDKAQSGSWNPLFPRVYRDS